MYAMWAGVGLTMRSASTRGLTLVVAVVVGSVLGAPLYRKIALLTLGSAIDGVSAMYSTIDVSTYW